MNIKPSMSKTLKTMDGVQVPCWKVSLTISDLESQADAELFTTRLLKAIGDKAKNTLDAFLEEAITA